MAVFRALVAPCLALACTFAFVRPAHGNPRPRPALHWSRGADASTCIDPRALSLRVTALTGPVLVEPSDADVSIEGHVEKRASGGFVVRISATDRTGKQRGERWLEEKGDDCRTLDAAITFVIALLIDPDLALERLPVRRSSLASLRYSAG